MAKGQVSSDDLATGIKSFGGLSSLGGSSRPVRDNPFRDTRAEPAAPVAPVAPPGPPPESPRPGVINGTDHPEAEAEPQVPEVVEPAPERKPAALRESQRRIPVAPAIIPEAKV